MLRPKGKISCRDAHEMIMLFARHGNHVYNKNFRSEADVKRAFARNGIDYEKLVRQCRDFNIKVPFFENLITSTAFSVGASLARVDNQTGATDLDTQGPGTLVLYAYHARFEAAIDAINRAIVESSYTHFQTALEEGVASIESYIKYRTELWNKKNPNQILSDSASNKVSFDKKISEWIPIMTGGRKLDQSGVIWNSFLTLRKIRDDVAIHPKSSGYSISFSKLADNINLFKKGIARLLVELHLLFDDAIPSIIIRAVYAPDVEYLLDTTQNQ